MRHQAARLSIKCRYDLNNPPGLRGPRGRSEPLLAGHFQDVSDYWIRAPIRWFQAACLRAEEQIPAPEERPDVALLAVVLQARGQVKGLGAVLGAELFSPTPAPKHADIQPSQPAQPFYFSLPWLIVAEPPGVRTCPPGRCEWLLRVWTEARTLSDPPGQFWRMRGCVGFHLA